jgi:hypothetical protein
VCQWICGAFSGHFGGRLAEQDRGRSIAGAAADIGEVSLRALELPLAVIVLALAVHAALALAVALLSLAVAVLPLLVGHDRFLSLTRPG